MRRDRRHPLRSRLLVAGVLLLAFGLRVAFVAATPYRAINDAGTYTRFASAVATDGDYTTGDNGPGTGAAGSRGPTAYFPPAYPYALSIADLLDGHAGGGRASLPGLRLENAALGTVTVGLIGLMALELCGDGPALAALGIAAVYPPLIELSGVLAAENLLVVLELAAVWAALRARGSPRPWRWIAAAGGLVGLATLAHENAALMLLALAVPAVGAAGIGGGGPSVAGATGAPGAAGAGAESEAGLRSDAPHAAAGRSVEGAGHHNEAGVRSGTPLPAGDPVAPAAERHRSAGSGLRRRVGAIALLAVAAAAVIAPWTARNALQLHHFVPVSDETGITLRGAYNPVSAADRTIPWKWRLFWTVPEDRGLRRHAGADSEVGLSRALEHRALAYIAAHPGAPFSVAAHNLLRMTELEGGAAWHASARAMDLPIGFAGVGVVGFWIVAALALAGLATRAVRRTPPWVWAVPVLFALSVIFVNVETPRFREPIDPFLIVLAGCALSAAVTRARARRLRSSPR